ncbi:MAG: NUDIX domain-containing protein [Actinomycetota bacterium]|nr:NUDIX domain-containing protein [Actinomycetota bacterium]
MTEDADAQAALHADARALLASWVPPNADQARLAGEYLAFLDEHPDAMSRSCRVGHLTASALVMDDSRTKVLLTLHPKAGRWLQLGGHCEPGDGTVRDAAIREAIEEGGIPDITMSDQPIHVDRHPVSCWGSPSEHLDVQFLATVPGNAEPVISEESDDLRWFALDALPDGLDAAVLAMIGHAARA